MIPSPQPLSADPHRPRYHFLPPRNWMNDPNGLIQWKGRYHLFYQHNPNGPLWGSMHWGHAASDDLIRWQHLPLALAPTPGGPDEAGCFSGCAVVDEKPTLIYTGTAGERHEIQTQCIATSDDDLLTWQKRPAPVLRDVPPEARQTSDFRDPFVWKEGDTWYMVLGSRIQDVGGAVFLYRSPNLIEWEYLHPLLTGDTPRSGAIWECPNFFRLGDHWVLIVSSHSGTETGSVIYFVGTYENFRFTPTSEGVLDHAALYAPLTFVDDWGRRLLMGWLREWRSEDEQRRAGWSGVQSIPRLLSLDSHQRLNLLVVPELERIRGTHHRVNGSDTYSEGDTSVQVSGLALDVSAVFAPEGEEHCGLRILFGRDAAESCDVVYDPARQALIVENRMRDAANPASRERWEIYHPLGADEPLRLRVLLDGSVLEIVANERTSLSNRVYPAQADSCTVQVAGAARHGAARHIAGLQSLDVWEMPSIW